MNRASPEIDRVCSTFMSGRNDAYDTGFALLPAVIFLIRLNLQWRRGHSCQATIGVGGMHSDASVEAPGRAAFDDMARAYDVSFTHTPVGKALRDIVWSRVVRVFHPLQHILELGCGTGEDALRFANAGFLVTATDASATMVEVASEKARRFSQHPRIEFQCVSMDGIAASFPGRSFGGVFSNFGAINCARDPRALAAATAKVLLPGSPLLWVVMGRHVPWEWAWYLMRGEPRKALRRFQPEGVKWRGLTVRYPTPAQLTAAIQPHFAVTRVSPLGCILPPSYAARWLDRSPHLLSALNRLETWAQHSSTLANWADHYIIEAVRC